MSSVLQQLSNQKSKSNRKHINNFLATIQQDRHAYEMFKTEAQKQGMLKRIPQRQF